MLSTVYSLLILLGMKSLTEFQLIHLKTNKPKVLGGQISFISIPVYLEGGLKVGTNARPNTFKLLVLTHWVTAPE